MAGLQDLLSWADNKRRVVGRNLSDLVNNPVDYLSMTAANIPQTVKEYGEDPMNFIGGGIGSIRMAPKNFLDLAAPFGYQGGRRPNLDTVEWLKSNQRPNNPYLTVKETDTGMQVGLHDGRHQAIAQMSKGEAMDVDIKAAQSLKRKYPNITEDQILEMIRSRGGLIDEMGIYGKRPISDLMNPRTD
jgi:hypothetical protein